MNSVGDNEAVSLPWGTEDDRLVIHADEASVADGHAMRVPAE
jgi:hypothetical protein